MNPQPDTLHDRITALLYDPSAQDETGTWLDRKRLADLLAETTTAQPEADAVERAARAIHRTRTGSDDLCGDEPNPTTACHVLARAALAAAQPVEPEPDEPVDLRTKHPSVTTWLDLTDRETLITALGSVEWSPFTHALADAVLAAGFRRSRPEATRTVTAEQVARLMEELAALDTLAEQAGALAFDPTHSGMATAYRLAARGVRAALGVTVADTPTQDGGDA